MDQEEINRRLVEVMIGIVDFVDQNSTLLMPAWQKMEGMKHLLDDLAGATREKP